VSGKLLSVAELARDGFDEERLIGARVESIEPDEHRRPVEGMADIDPSAAAEISGEAPRRPDLAAGPMPGEPPAERPVAVIVDARVGDFRVEPFVVFEAERIEPDERVDQGNAESP
jgi:hypothetical protein